MMIETRTENIWMENGIVRAVTKKVEEHSVTDAKENVIAANQISNGMRYPLLVDIRQTKNISIDARKYYISADNHYVSACAFVIGSPVSFMIAKMFMGINKPPFPTRFFRTDKKAVDWLSEFKLLA